MRMKIFQSHTKVELEGAVNKWLAEHPVTPNSMHFQFSTTMQEDADVYHLIYTLVLFYVPVGLQSENQE